MVAAPASAQERAPRVVASGLAADDRPWLVVHTAQPESALSLSVHVDERPVDAEIDALLGERSAVAVVMDTAAPREVRQAALSGATSFVMQLPASASAAVVNDSDPPVIAAPSGSARAAVTALTRPASGSGRSTSEAIALALQAFPEQTRARVVLLWTAAADAGPNAAAELRRRLLAADAVLAVVVPAGTPTAYWREVAESTGGVVVSSRPAQHLVAFDRVATSLRARRRVALTEAIHRAAELSVGMKDADGDMTYVDVPLPARAPTAAASRSAAPAASRPAATVAPTAAATQRGQAPTAPTAPVGASPQPDAASPMERGTIAMLEILLVLVVVGVIVALVAQVTRTETATAGDPAAEADPIVLDSLESYGVSDGGPGGRPHSTDPDVVVAPGGRHAPAPDTPAAPDATGAQPASGGRRLNGDGARAQRFAGTPAAAPAAGMPSGEPQIGDVIATTYERARAVAAATQAASRAAGARRQAAAPEPIVLPNGASEPIVLPDAAPKADPPVKRAPGRR